MKGIQVTGALRRNWGYMLILLRFCEHQLYQGYQFCAFLLACAWTRLWNKHHDESQYSVDVPGTHEFHCVSLSIRVSNTRAPKETRCPIPVHEHSCITLGCDCTSGKQEQAAAGTGAGWAAPSPGHWDPSDSSTRLSLSPLPQEQSSGQDCTAETSSAGKSLLLSLSLWVLSPTELWAAEESSVPAWQEGSASTALTCRAPTPLHSHETARVNPTPEQGPESHQHGEEENTFIVWGIRCLQQSYSKLWHCLTTTNRAMLFTSMCLRHLGVVCSLLQFNLLHLSEMCVQRKSHREQPMTVPLS